MHKEHSVRYRTQAANPPVDGPINRCLLATSFFLKIFIDLMVILIFVFCQRIRFLV